MARKKSEVIEEVAISETVDAIVESSETVVENVSVVDVPTEEVVIETPNIEISTLNEIEDTKEESVEKPTKTRAKKVNIVAPVPEVQSEVINSTTISEKKSDADVEDEIKSIVVQNIRIYLAPNTKCSSTLYSGVVTKLSEDNGFCKVIYRIPGNSICATGYIQI